MPVDGRAPVRRRWRLIIKGALGLRFLKLVIGLMDALGRLEQSYHDDTCHNVFSHFLVLDQDGGQDMVVDKESDKEKQHVAPCVKQSILDPKRMLGVIIDDKLREGCQEDDKPHNRVDDGFLLGLLEVIAHGCGAIVNCQAKIIIPVCTAK
jgi:hypothetical protein